MRARRLERMAEYELGSRRDMAFWLGDGVILAVFTKISDTTSMIDK